MELYMDILKMGMMALSVFVTLAGIKCCIGIFASYSIREEGWNKKGGIYERLGRVEIDIYLGLSILILLIVTEFINTEGVAYPIMIAKGICAIIVTVLMLIRQNMMNTIKAEKS